ncbi:MAG: TlpA family protein disulfide reductase [Bacteroidota bacterium]
MVKGKILNLSEAELQATKINYAIVVPFFKWNVDKTTRPNSDGTFELVLDHPFPNQQVWITVGDYLYSGIHVNSDLYIELDAAKLKAQEGVDQIGDGVTFKGSDGELTTYLCNRNIFNREQEGAFFRSKVDINRDRKLSPEEYLVKYDRLYDEWRTFDEEFIQQDSSQYASLIRNDKTSNYYSSILIKFSGRGLPKELATKVENHRPLLISNDGVDFYNSLFYYASSFARKNSNINYASLKVYSKLTPYDQALLDSVIELEGRLHKTVKQDSVTYATLSKSADSLLQDTLYVEGIKRISSAIDSLYSSPRSDILKLFIGTIDYLAGAKNPEQQKLMLETVIPTMNTDWCKQLLKEQHDLAIEALEKQELTLSEAVPFTSNLKLGRPTVELPTGARLYVADSLDANTLLESMKSSFKGKALLMDFWATFCRPCLDEMPHSRQLQQEAKNLSVEFIYLCTDNGASYEKWKSQVAEFGVRGTHILVNDETIRELLTQFKNRPAYPSYVFFDKDGTHQPDAVRRVSELTIEKLTTLVD